MSKKTPTSKPLPDAESRLKDIEPIFGSQSFQILVQEYDTLKDLFGQTETAIQNIFNFYITLVTAVVGGIAIIIQTAPLGPATSNSSQLIICGLLLLAAVIGTVYLLSLAARYARLIQYGRGLDAIRKHLIQISKAPVPGVYDQFLTYKRASHAGLNLGNLFAWLLPTGTYQLAIAFINSLAFAIATWLILSITGVTVSRLGDSLISVFVEFLLIFNVYNVYSRVAIQHWLADISLHIDPQFAHPFQMIR